jgi:hypothetical protein
MHNPYELFAGLRYTRAKRRNHFISFISLASMLGIAIGVTALITVLSVMNGFERELRTRILGMASHATISAFRGGLPDWPGVAELASRNPEIIGLAPYIEGEGMVKVGSELSGTLLRGVLPAEEVKVSDIGQHVVAGTLDSLEAGAFNVVLGYELASALGATLGDKIDLMIPQASVTPAGVMPRFRRFTVSGIFRVGMYEFDRGMVLVHLTDAQALLRMDDTVTGVRLKLQDMFRAPLVARDLAGELPGMFYVNDWTRSHANFFRAVRTEKMVMFIILSLIVGVQHRLHAGDGGAGQAGRHRDPAHARRHAAFDHGDLHGPGLDHRHRRHAAWRCRRHRAGTQCRDPGAAARASDGPAVPGARRVLHQRPAVGAQVERHRAHRQPVAGTGPAIDAVPGLARLAGAAGRSAALRVAS